MKWPTKSTKRQKNVMLNRLQRGYLYSMRADTRRQNVTLLDLRWRCACQVILIFFLLCTSLPMIMKTLWASMWDFRARFGENQWMTKKDYILPSASCCYKHVCHLTHKNPGMETRCLGSMSLLLSTLTFNINQKSISLLLTKYLGCLGGSVS